MQLRDKFNSIVLYNFHLDPNNDMRSDMHTDIHISKIFCHKGLELCRHGMVQFCSVIKWIFTHHIVCVSSASFTDYLIQVMLHKPV